MATITNTGRVPFMLPIGIRVGAGETVTVENVDIQRPDSWPALQALKACGEAVWELDPEPTLFERVTAANSGPVQSLPDEPAPAEVVPPVDDQIDATSPETAALKPSRK